MLCSMNTSYTLITGASSGIGAACAEHIAALGRNLILIARREEKLEAIKQQLETEHGIKVLTYKVDLLKVEEIDALFTKVKDKQIDVLVNSAGGAWGATDFESNAWEDFNTMIDLNIKAFTKVTHLAVPFIKETKGHIFNISSVAGIEAYEGGSVYCGTKAFVKMLSKALRIDLMGTGVRVTDIGPGAVDTEFSTVRYKGDKNAADAVYKGYTPLYAVDIANAITYALQQPNSVNVDTINIMPTAQASARRIHKDQS